MEDDIIKTLSIVAKLPVDEKECLIRVMSEMKDAINVLNGLLSSRKEENDTLRAENVELRVNKGRTDVITINRNHNNDKELEKKTKEDGKRKKKALTALEYQTKKENNYLGAIAAFSDSEPLQLLSNTHGETPMLSRIDPHIEVNKLDIGKIGVGDNELQKQSNSTLTNLQFVDTDAEMTNVGISTDVTKTTAEISRSVPEIKVSKSNHLPSEETSQKSTPNKKRRTDNVYDNNNDQLTGWEIFLHNVYEQANFPGKLLSIHMKVDEQIKLFDGANQISYDPKNLKEIIVCLMNNINDNNILQIAHTIRIYSTNTLHDAILCYISCAIDTYMYSLLPSSADSPSLLDISSLIFIKTENIVCLLQLILTRCHQGRKYIHDLEKLLRRHILNELSSRVEVPLLYTFSKLNCGGIKFKNIPKSGSNENKNKNNDKMADFEQDTLSPNSIKSKAMLVLDLKLVSLSYIVTGLDIKYECGKSICSYVDEIVLSIQTFGINYVGPIFGMLESIMSSTNHNHSKTHIHDLYNTFSFLYFEIDKNNTVGDISNDFSCISSSGFQEFQATKDFDRVTIYCKVIRKQMMDYVVNAMKAFLDKLGCTTTLTSNVNQIIGRLNRCSGDSSGVSSSEMKWIVECLIEERKIINNYTEALQVVSSPPLANQISGLSLKTIPFICRRVGFWALIQMMGRHSEDTSIGDALSGLGLSYAYSEATDLIKLSEYSFLKTASSDKRTTCEELFYNLRPLKECGDKQFVKYYTEKEEEVPSHNMFQIENCVVKSFKNYWNRLFSNNRNDIEELTRSIILNCRFIFSLVNSYDNVIDSPNYIYSSIKNPSKLSDSLYDLSNLLDKKLKSGRQIATKWNFTSINAAYSNSARKSSPGYVFCATSATPELVLNASTFFDNCIAFGDNLSSTIDTSEQFSFRDYSDIFSRTTREIVSLLCASYFERFLFFLSSSIRSLVLELITNNSLFQNGERAISDTVIYTLCNEVIGYLAFNPILCSGTVRSDILRDCVILARKVPVEYLSQRVKQWLISCSNRLPVFVINLDHRYDRWKSTLIQCEENFLTAIRCRAIDGKNIPKEGVLEQINCDDDIVNENDVAWTYSGRELSKYDPSFSDNKKIPSTPSERACAASHINVWRAISNFRKRNLKLTKKTTKASLLESGKDVVLSDIIRETSALTSMGNYYQKFERFEEIQINDGLSESKTLLQSHDWYVIFEDDVQIKKANLVPNNKFSLDSDSKYRSLATFVDILIRDELPNDFDIFVLGCKHSIPKKKTEERKKNSKIIDNRITKLHFFFQLHAYIITGNAIEKILANHLPVYGPIDMYISELITHNKLTGYTMTDNAVDQFILNNGINTVGRADIVKSGRKKRASGEDLIIIDTH